MPGTAGRVNVKVKSAVSVARVCDPGDRKVVKER
jgi:hypothetical protein